MLLSLLILLPVIILGLAVLGMYILRQTRPGIGYAWLITALACLLLVAAMIFLRGQLPLQFMVEQEPPFGMFSSLPVLLLDLKSWPYAFSLAVVALAFILTDSARLETEARPLNWAAGLVLTGVGLLAVMAGSPVSLVLIWTAVDLLELVMVLATDAGRRMGQQTVTLFSVRVAGTLLVLLAIFVARSRGLPFDLEPIPSPLAVYILLASGLRLGVLPLNVAYVREVYAWRGLGHVLRMLGPASALVVLGRMPDQAVPDQMRPIFLIFTALAAIFGAVMWLTASHEINGRSYWSIALAALAVASVVNGSAQASIAWGTTLLLVGSTIFFNSASRRRNMLLPVLAMIGIAGLPYNPAAVGWVGIAGSGPLSFTIVALFTVALLMLGYLRHALRPREELHRMERWIHTVYPAGLFVLIAAHWLIGIIGWPGSLAPGVWWASTASVLIASFGFGLAMLLRQRINRDVIANRWIGHFAQRVGSFLGALFRLNWLYRLFTSIYHILQNLVQLITEVLEGDGGILWSLVMLALLVSLIWSRGAP